MPPDGGKGPPETGGKTMSEQATATRGPEAADLSGIDPKHLPRRKPKKDETPERLPGRVGSLGKWTDYQTGDVVSDAQGLRVVEAAGPAYVVTSAGPAQRYQVVYTRPATAQERGVHDATRAVVSAQARFGAVADRVVNRPVDKAKYPTYLTPAEAAEEFGRLADEYRGHLEALRQAGKPTKDAENAVQLAEYHQSRHAKMGQ